MRRTLRRILWIVPSLVVASLLLFWFVAPSSQVRGTDEQTLPLFFEDNPSSVRELAIDAVRAIENSSGGDSEAAAALSELGGAALPHVLPILDTLGPEARSRVALALGPVGTRMGVGGADLRDPEAAVLFWTRFWQDRAIDFRPQVVSRAVKRFATRASPGRRDDVLALDTYALGELVSAIGPMRSSDDVQRAARLTDLASHMTGLSLRVSDRASVAEARETTTTWQRFWREHRYRYTTLEGPDRLVAMVTQTRYGRWAESVVYTQLGVSHSGEPVLVVARKRAPVTLWLLGMALCGGFLIGTALGLVSAVHRGADLVLASAALVLAVAPAATLAIILAPAGTFPRLGSAAALMAVVVALRVARYQRVESKSELDQEHALTRRAFGASPLHTVWLSFRNGSSAVVSLAGRELPLLLSVAIVVEHAVGLPGLGTVTLVAVATGDVAWLMAFGLCTVTLAALLQIASDSLLASLNPRIADALDTKRGIES